MDIIDKDYIVPPHKLAYEIAIGPVGFFMFKYASVAIAILVWIHLWVNNTSNNPFWIGVFTLFTLFIVGTMPVIRIVLWPIFVFLILHWLIYAPHTLQAFMTGDDLSMHILGIPVGWVYIGLLLLGVESIVQAGIYQNNLDTIIVGIVASMLYKHHSRHHRNH